MGVEVCMNGYCKNGSAREWKKGWPLISGGFARLCNKCGHAYENSVFCDNFHRHETGWRECSYCSKPIHCGCIVSRSLFEYLDFGGIRCVICVKASRPCLIRNTENPNGSVRSTNNIASDRHAEHIDGRLLVDSAGKGKLMQLCRIAEASESSRWPQAQRDGEVSCIVPNSQEVKHPFMEEDTRLSNVMKQSSHSLTFTTLENNRTTWENKSMHELLSRNISLGTSSGNRILPSYPILPSSSKTGLTMNLETNKGMISQACIARLPAEGRGNHQLLSRYWPRITDQELKQLSGDLKSTVVPLFEKMLSASDAGRIGRLVLPKACAEAYFPPISQSEGLPLQFQDVKGNEWTFQFRFWPNNNSRMYVLEGVTPCIQSMQLNAGDTVIFSRIDPGDKFVLGFRRASYSKDAQDASTSAHSDGISTKETTFSIATENLHSGNSYPDLLQSRKGNGEPYLNEQAEHLYLGTGTADWLQNENCEMMMNNDSLQQPISVSEKRTCNIGPKTKRLLIHSEDAMELRLSWEEAQDLLCPPPSVEPSIVTIEDQVIEEYEEPPVFGKSTTFDACPPGSSGSASEQLSTKESENLLITNKEREPFGLDALASAAGLGDNIVDPTESSAGVSNKHPRHRPGCTCIVCIQPPSGKGRHKPTCSCHGCKTVKRRYKTRMHNKKQHQSVSEADAVPKDQIHHRDEPDINAASREDTSPLEKEGSLNKGRLQMGKLSLGQIDLNSDPNLEDMQLDI